jgi:nicotinate-nucleotide adenylyltransferase
MKRVAVFGGAFDPIHFGHLILAQDIIETASAERILFMPSFKPPHKQCFAPFEDRLQMARLATRGNPHFRCSGLEAELSQPSYTIRTLRALGKELGDGGISFIMGMDSAIEFDTWKEPEALLDEFTIVVIPRPGFSREDIKELYAGRMLFLSTRQIDISSTEIREKIRDGKEVRYLTTNEVISYIAKKGLYAKDHSSS